MPSIQFRSSGGCREPTGGGRRENFVGQTKAQSAVFVYPARDECGYGAKGRTERDASIAITVRAATRASCLRRHRGDDELAGAGVDDAGKEQAFQRREAESGGVQPKAKATGR